MITEVNFSIGELVREMKKPEICAIVTFLGVVREEGEIKGMVVEVYREMAEEKLEKLKQDALEKFDIESVKIVHREGPLKVGENIVVILVGAKASKGCFSGL